MKKGKGRNYKIYTIIIGETVGQNSPYDRVIGRDIAVGYKDLIKKLKEIKSNYFGFDKMSIRKALKNREWSYLDYEIDSFGNRNYSGYWLDIVDDILENDVIKEKYEGWW